MLSFASRIAQRGVRVAPKGSRGLLTASRPALGGVCQSTGDKARHPDLGERHESEELRHGIRIWVGDRKRGVGGVW
jgi:hypothetical protein